MKFDIITIFPKMFSAFGGSASGGESPYFNYGILKRAQEKRPAEGEARPAGRLIKITAHNLRDFAKDKHKKVDDRPYGGGPGMVIKIEPVYRAVQFLKSKVKGQRSKARTILFSTRGKKLDSKTSKRLSKYNQLILICGRYEGVDERVAKHIADEEISVGDYVLSGGELPAMILVDAVSRQIPGVLGKRESLEEIKGSYPVYTRPEVFIPKLKTKNLKLKTKKWKVPKELLSGHHKKIAAWRQN